MELASEVWANLFAGLSKLQTLILNSNGLSELPAEIFLGLSIFPADIFSGLRNLQEQELNLRSNKLGKLPSEFWSKVPEGLSGLQELYLGRNNLSKLPAGVFSRLGKLRKLSLSSCKLNELPLEVWDNLFAGLDNLQELLDDNRLSELPAEVWRKGLSALSHFQELYLEENDLSELLAICSAIRCYA